MLPSFSVVPKSNSITCQITIVESLFEVAILDLVVNSILHRGFLFLYITAAFAVAEPAVC